MLNRKILALLMVMSFLGFEPAFAVEISPSLNGIEENTGNSLVENHHIGKQKNIENSDYHITSKTHRYTKDKHYHKNTPKTKYVHKQTYKTKKISQIHKKYKKDIISIVDKNITYPKEKNPHPTENISNSTIMNGTVENQSVINQTGINGSISNQTFNNNSSLENNTNLTNNTPTINDTIDSNSTINDTNTTNPSNITNITTTMLKQDDEESTKSKVTDTLLAVGYLAATIAGACAMNPEPLVSKVVCVVAVAVAVVSFVAVICLKWFW